MAKPKIPNQKSKYKALNARLKKYTLLAQAAVATFITEAVNTLYLIDYDGTEAFTFDSNPVTKGQLAEKRSNFITRLFGLFLTGIALEWAESNKVQDTVADKVLSAYGGKKIEGFYQDNNDKLRAFQSRVYSGRTTYDRLGEIANTMQKEVETAVSVSGGSPIPIVQTKVERYFSDVDTLRKDFKQKFGYEPHVQDSQYQAARLLRSEINMAYRTAEQERWKQMDFVVGYEIKLSATHHDRMPKGDICDTLAGKYPKWFKWSGWHPGDLCYAIPILKTEDEFFNDLPSQNEVCDVPLAMRNWIKDNSDYIARCEKIGTTPYWLKDNDYKQFTKFNDKAEQYYSLKENQEYKDVFFDPQNGGLKATHIQHNFDKVGGNYELHVQDAGYKEGHSVIFEKEKEGAFGQRFTEGLFDGKTFEIAGRENPANNNNLLAGLKHCASKRTTQIAVLDYPVGGFNAKALERALKRYRGLEKLNDGQYLKFERLICVEGGKIVYNVDF